MQIAKPLLMLAATVAASAFASEHVISYETLSYPSPAVAHFSILQNGLAEKAIDTCGAADKVAGLRRITITIDRGDEIVAQLARGLRDQPALTFIYPMINASAQLTCRD